MKQVSQLKNVFYGIALLLFSLAPLHAANPPSHAIASAHPLATEAGMMILQKGGNAFDAAVTVSAVLAVVEPYSSGFGGGGFWLLHRASDGKNIMIDGRETAPGEARGDMYLEKNGEVAPKRSIDGPLAAGIPGMPAALVHLAKRYGKLPLKTTLGPAMDLAQKGFEVDEHYRRMAGFRLQALRASDDAAKIFLDSGEVPAAGYRIVQKDLALVIRALAGKGRAGFYEGRIAKVLVDGVRRGGGIWRLSDLKKYRIKERQPIVIRYQDTKIISAAPPSSGGIALATMLHILEQDPLQTMAPQTQTHLVVEAMRRAYRDRAEYLGDPDFVKIPVKMLTNPMYARGLRNTIHLHKATPSELLPGVMAKSGGRDTTHFSILDKNGNRVAATLSINYPFGACFVVPRTGILLNDEMDDFVSKPGHPNAYGLVGAEANAIAPFKRPLSSMSPTFLEGPRGVAILGTPGGSRIITMVLHGILAYQQGEKPQQWVNKPRYHHQYLPDVIQHEKDMFTGEQIKQLQGMGHKLKAIDYRFGNMQAILWDRKNNQVQAASDNRGIGKAMVK